MWNKHGEYHCVCGTIFGKNLLNQSPYGIVYQHLQNCEKYIEKKYQDHLDWEKSEAEKQ